MRVVVLDRPNPIDGLTREGRVHEELRLRSFVGLEPIPIRHAIEDVEFTLALAGLSVYTQLDADTSKMLLAVAAFVAGVQANSETTKAVVDKLAGPDAWAFLTALVSPVK